MRISDWSSDVCSSDLPEEDQPLAHQNSRISAGFLDASCSVCALFLYRLQGIMRPTFRVLKRTGKRSCDQQSSGLRSSFKTNDDRSEEHTSELQSLMRISYAVFCLKKKNKTTTLETTVHNTNT